MASACKRLWYPLLDTATVNHNFIEDAHTVEGT